MLAFKCPACKNQLHVSEGKAGHKVACPSCGQLLQVPLPRQPPRPAPAQPKPTTAEPATERGELVPPVVQPAAKKTGPAQPVPVVAEAPAEEVFRDAVESPPPPVKRKARYTFLTLALVSGIALAVGLVVGGLGGFSAGRSSTSGDPSLAGGNDPVRLPGNVLAAWQEEQRRNADVRYEGRPLHRWAAQLYDKDLATKQEASGALAAIGKESLPYTAQAMAEGDLDTKLEARKVFNAIGAPSLPYLRELMKSADYDTRWQSAFAVAWNGALTAEDKRTAKRILTEPPPKGLEGRQVVNQETLDLVR
jgi:hypothetical protein